MEQSLILDAGLVLGRLFVGGTLVLAGVLKLKAGTRWFLRQILAYEPVRDRLAWLLVRGLPWAEILCGILFLVGLSTPLVAIISFTLLWGFTAAIISTFLRGKPVDCGCFGRRITTQAHQARWTVTYRNLGLMGILALVYIAGITPLSVDIWLSEWLYFVGFDASVARWLAIIWGCSLVLTIGLQLLVRNRLLLGEKLSQTTPSTQSN